MARSSRELKKGTDYNVQLTAKGIGPLSDELIEKDSLGPFMRISQMNDNVIYLYAYFHEKVKEFHFKITETTDDTTSVLGILLDSYALNIDVIEKFEEPTTPQNLWAFIIQTNVSIKNERIVNCNINFNYKSKENTDTHTKSSLLDPVGVPRRGTKVIIAKLTDED
ncbi:hypothetical protein [uncultured Kordia sp.]|uniref:hypothetical protein n=1 Tax=uncultured Kordia sp. TaxID=507699 RepID=UPI002636499C|nr:hypothetical protein [uncultured Kordia sp.]